MTRAPKQIPTDGVVECSDSMNTAVAAGIGAAASAGVVAYALTHMEFTAEHGGILWAPLAGVLAFDLLVSAGVAGGYATECRDAKRRGAEQGAVFARQQAQAKARAEAGTLSKRAAAAARADDCATVRELDPEIRALDVEFHAVVFSRDVAIARCLTATRPIAE